ncbi:hypothetical protein J6590_070596 [Homalodisca vitripennis]|nr:hypothetical protein J6590_070596 [Homalodisca vitripennis]
MPPKLSQAEIEGRPAVLSEPFSRNVFISLGWLRLYCLFKLVLSQNLKEIQYPKPLRKRFTRFRKTIIDSLSCIIPLTRAVAGEIMMGKVIGIQARVTNYTNL